VRGAGDRQARQDRRGLGEQAFLDRARQGELPGAGVHLHLRVPPLDELDDLAAQAG
jgi:hypothetical protein